MKITVKSLGLIGALGGVGGLINGWLCYVKYPAAVVKIETFSWPIIPLGALHGALLAVISVGLACFFWKRRLFLRLIGLAVSGYLAGWVSFIPIHYYFVHIKSPLFSSSSPQKLTLEALISLIFWPFSGSFKLATFYVPYPYFGLVGSVYYFFLTLCSQLTCRRLSIHLLLGVSSGILGSLWWWISFKPWYFSLIHGTIWGMLVGLGVWRIHASGVCKRVVGDERDNL